MPRTERQELGRRGEKAVHDRVACPRCGRARHLTPLPMNFQCADLICKFCGFLAQVKSTRLVEGRLPARIMGAAWGPQRDQIIAGIFHALFIVGFTPAKRLVSIDYVPSHVLQSVPQVFEPRAPLSPRAQRAGWTGFNYNLTAIPPVGIRRVYPPGGKVVSE